MRRRVSLLWVVVLFTVSCTSYLSDVEAVYLEGRYLEVAETLAQREDEVARLSLEQQARYCLYRGLALLHIGDRVGAEYWLCLCHALDTVTAAKLTPRQRQLLKEGRRVLRKRHGKEPSPNGRRPGR